MADLQILIWKKKAQRTQNTVRKQQKQGMKKRLTTARPWSFSVNHLSGDKLLILKPNNVDSCISDKI